MQLYYLPEEKLRSALAHRPYQSLTVDPSVFLSKKESMEIINWTAQGIKKRRRIGQKGDIPEMSTGMEIQRLNRGGTEGSNKPDFKGSPRSIQGSHSHSINANI